MTTDVATTDRTQLEKAFRVLYLLPTAPRELVDAAYAVLSGDSASSDLRRAYETIVSTPDIDTDFHLPRQTSPWELLHLCSDAPRSVMAAAYDFWRGDAEPLVIRPPVIDLMAPLSVGPQAPSSPLPHAGEGLGVRVESTTFVSVFEELLDAREEIEQQSSAAELSSPLPWGEGPGVRAEPEELLEMSEEIEQPTAVVASPPRRVGEGSDYFVYTYEELFNATVDEPNSPLPWGEGQGVRAEGRWPTVGAKPTLIGADGTSLTLDLRPLRIGTQPSCDVVVRADARVEARVWRNKGRVLVHALGEPGLVLVNGAPATWAVLTDGDTLAVGPVSFSYRAPELT
jgi:hypothetical protein